MSFIVISRDTIDRFLTSKGFTSSFVGGELTYYRHHEEDKSLRVLVYTSIKYGENETQGLGKDAIRVCAVQTLVRNGVSKTYGVMKLSRVHRTGTVNGVLSRMLDRMREAYRACNGIVIQDRKYARFQNSSYRRGQASR